jgi:thiol-disulfide isomerase/thioredoxin
MLRKITITLFLIGLIIGLAYFFYDRYRVAPEVVYTNIKASDLAGNSFVFDNSSGKSHIILFFATWCIDCRRELPILEQQTQLLNDLGIDVFLLSDESIETLLKFSPQIKEPFKLLKLDGSFKDNGIYTLPTAYLYCPSGKLHQNKVGAIHLDGRIPQSILIKL